MLRFQILPEAVEASDCTLMPCAACDVREMAVCSVLQRTEFDHLTRIVARVPVASG